MKDTMRHMVIDRLIMERKYVTFQEMLDVLQVSEPTLKRDLRYMREQLAAPIVYLRSRNVYTYRHVEGDKVAPLTKGTTPQRVLPTRSWYSPQELYFLARTASMIDDLAKDETSVVRPLLEPLRARIAAFFRLGDRLPMDLMDRVKVIGESSGIFDEPNTFYTIGIALNESRRVTIQYENTNRRRPGTVREISPLRLVHYRNRWYIDSYCHTRNEYRTFAIEHIRRAELLRKTCVKVGPREMAQQFDSTYGLFRSGEVKQAVLLVDKEVAPFVRRLYWHDKQRLVVHGDGFRLTFPYGNPTELVGEIIRWGKHVQVESPEELRQQVKQALLETLDIYQSPKMKAD